MEPCLLLSFHKTELTNQINDQSMIRKRRNKIVIVDDDPDDQYFLNNAFHRIDKDLDINFLDSGDDLLNFFQNDCNLSVFPDLIILDLNMPKMNGKEVLKRIKSIDKLRFLPVVVFSTSSSEKEVKEVYELGANTFIVKPSTYQQVFDVAKNIYDYWFLTAERTSIYTGVRHII